MNKQTITINGVTYDSASGLRIEANEPQQAPASAPDKPTTERSASTSAATLHAAQAKSTTLNRQYVAKIASKQPVARAERPRQNIARSAQISKFAPHPVAVAQPTRKPVMDIAPAAHPLVARAQAKQEQGKHVAQPSTPQVHHAVAPAATTPSAVLKQEAIAQAVEQTASRTHAERAHTKQAKRHSKSRFMSLSTAGIALMLLAGYFTYINMPNLSVRVAAAQAGIDASYPGYQPDGYSLSGPVAYSSGQVTMKFASNTGSQNFTVAQTKSNWDSGAVLDNFVKQKAGENYLTYNDQGLTIYTFDSNAAWVNGGILYTVSGDAPLSGDQIRRIATSM